MPSDPPVSASHPGGTRPADSRDAPRQRPPRRRSSASAQVSRTAARTLKVARRNLGAQADRTLHGFVNGLDWFLRDPEDVVGRTPWTAALTRDKLTVRRYTALDDEHDWGLGATGTQTSDAPTTGAGAPPTGQIPVLLVPPLMVKPYIFDLTEERSLVRTLLQARFPTFLVDFGEPDDNDANVRLDDYVLDWMPAAVDAVCEATGSDRVFILGYCMGGLFALMHAAANEDERVAGIVTIGSPIDSRKMGVLSLLSRKLHREVDLLSRAIGNVPGELSSSMFKMMSPLKQVTRYADLFMNLYDEEYVKGFDALSAWTNNFIDYPQDAFRQLFAEFMLDNKLKDGQLAFGHDRPGGPKVADLSRITAPVLAFAGATDNVVREAAVRSITRVTASKDVSVRVAPGGHMGVFAGRHAPEQVWRPAVAWMQERARVA